MNDDQVLIKELRTKVAKQEWFIVTILASLRSERAARELEARSNYQEMMNRNLQAQVDDMQQRLEALWKENQALKASSTRASS